MTSLRSIWITGFLLTSLTEAQTWRREREAFEGEARSSSSYTLSNSLVLSGCFLRAQKESNISSCHQENKWQQMPAGMWEKRNSCSWLVGGRTCTAIMDISIRFLSRLKLYALAFTVACAIRDTRTSVSIAAPFTITKIWNQSRCPSTDE